LSDRNQTSFKQSCHLRVSRQTKKSSEENDDGARSGNATSWVEDVELDQRLVEVFSKNAQAGTTLESMSTPMTIFFTKRELRELDEILAFDIECRKKQGSIAFCDSMFYSFEEFARTVEQRTE